MFEDFWYEISSVCELKVFNLSNSLFCWMSMPASSSEEEEACEKDKRKNVLSKECEKLILNNKKNYFHFNFIIMCRNVFSFFSLALFVLFIKYFSLFFSCYVCYHSSLLFHIASHHHELSFLTQCAPPQQRGHRRQDERSTLGNINSLLVLNLFAHGKLW